MRVTFSQRSPTKISADTYLVVFRAPRRGLLQLPLSTKLHPDAASMVSTRPEAITWLETRSLPTPRMLCYCLGKQPEPWDPSLEYLNGHAGSLGRETWAIQERRAARVAGAQIERACDLLGSKQVALIAWPEDIDPSLVVEGMLLRGHDARAWERSEPTPENCSDSSLRRISVCAPDPNPDPALGPRLRERVAVTEATNFARVLGDLPSNHGAAADIVSRVRAELERRGARLQLSTISAAEAEAAGMGLFTAVDAGAPSRGCVLLLEHRGRARAQTDDRAEEIEETEETKETEEIIEPVDLSLVGKGITHDTGGYNLKAGPTLHELTHDKCGATAVIGAMLAIDALGLPIDVLAMCPLTENCVDALAYKPGDVLRACDGTTVYVEDTDAEGRLALADTLAWLREHGPEAALTVDVATLTGSIHAGLGEAYAGLFCNEDRARALLEAAGQRSGELLWPMPIHELHERELLHHKADLRNVGAPFGAASSAAAFLRAFVRSPWAHLDIAGKSHTEFARECFGPGATGYGVRLLVELARGILADAHSQH
ncbi:hypothetical protein G6O69_10710 [Pseudenhygromyxa sp. WMMC2535]|uniref:leucyl aminopeptidase family protein n=1 Tax=Pseudenhygromyxa sp. WMMC2535 TaxID=2712867 RepID=UPI001553962C|nr:hypothetical protein [Pseudenhygromyxa sp. WMMC2535]NVB38303.1 hypothetical protein [Pseudenhygromyxa sp. WMMC2535]